MATARWKDLCIDASRPEPVARFWADALDLEASAKDDGNWVLDGVRSERTVWINGVPEPKTVKNRVHMDIVTDDLDALVAHGARVLRAKGDGGIGLTVLADPQGNEFCAITPD